MDLALKGKSVVITGGGSNIGRAIVLAFAEEGANITIGDIDEVQAGKVAELALKSGAAGVQVVKTDVTNIEQVKGMFDASVDKFGPLDVLVNNVGWTRMVLFTDTKPDFWQQTVQLNYMSALNCTSVALDLMIPNKRGAIVSISSDAGRQGQLRQAVYSGTKAGVNGFMKSIARENGRDGIRCNVVSPGPVLPEDVSELGSESLWSKGDVSYTPEVAEQVAKSLPLRKVTRARDIAGAVLFLASSRAGHITGQVLSVSGGFSMVG
jgi:2-hydroxycyclohexanecarboxyl-CoA dehydrogenase